MPRVILTLALVVLSPATVAAPTVNGNTVSWPDDGWYQVQSDNGVGIVEVCAGGQECTVPAGKYIVINHTTGERFIDIHVPAMASTSVSVWGHTISWPDDGWYQVQTADTYRQVCGGGLSCTTDPGTYIVINHTTGRRFEGVTVPDLVEPTSGIEVDGNTIRWPDDGWYQVQNATTYDSLCSGTRSCDVAPGTYIVINHTTGKRHENVLVAGAQVTPEPTADTFRGVSWRDIATTATRALSTLQFEAFDESIRATALALGAEVPLVGSTSQGVADCSDGGTMTWKNETQFSTLGRGVKSTLAYAFDQCDTAGRTINGRYEQIGDSGSVQFESASRQTREYQMTVTDEQAVVELQGSVLRSTRRGISFTCGSATTTSRSEAEFTQIATGALIEGYTLEALTINTEGSTQTLGSQQTGDCISVLEHESHDYARIDMADVGLLDVRRTGTYRNNTQNAERWDPANAVLEIRAADETGDWLSVRSTGEADEVLLTIGESGAVTSFQSTWTFAN